MNDHTPQWRDFPSRNGLRKGRWHAVHFSPNPDTSERLVVAVVGIVGNSWSVAEANSLRRLNCLFGSEAVTAVVAIQTAIEDLKTRLGAHGVAAIDSPMAVSGITLSEPRNGEAVDAASLARSWLGAISSVHDQRRSSIPAAEQAVSVAEDVVDIEIRRDRLPILVMREVESLWPILSGAFNRQIKLRAQHRDVRIKPQEVYIAFSGSKLVANFATLKVGRRKRTVDLSKRLMWDLEQHRRKADLVEDRRHEMLLYHPPKDDPELTERQYGNLQEVAQELGEQGHKSGIEVVTYHSVPRIAQHVVDQEMRGPSGMGVEVAPVS